MKVVMTVLARDEADVIDAQLAFHLNAGVDFVVATDNRSEDGTTEVFEWYAQQGLLHLIREPGEDLRQGEWVTRMARLAATEFGADWIINSDADEFWWPRASSLKRALESIPPRYGAVHAFVRHFPPGPGEGFFADRMTVRLNPAAPLIDPANPYQPYRKVIHRADPDVVVSRGNHALQESALVLLAGWYPIEVLHFPIRSAEQIRHKAELQWTAFAKSARGRGTAYHEKAFLAVQEGRTQEYYEALVIAGDSLERGLRDRSLVRDTRLRDALRALRAAPGRKSPTGFALSLAGPALSFPEPDLADAAAYAVDAAVLTEADLVRVQRRLEALEQRLRAVEQRLPARLSRKLGALAKRIRGRQAGGGD
jgi:hypothetical protein